MLKLGNVLRWGMFWTVLVDSVMAETLLANGVQPRFQNISSSLPPVSSPSPDTASTRLPQAPADYCGLCIIEAPGGIRLVYWEPDDVEPQANVTVNPNQPYTTVDNGFTYISPSVYVIYSELQATVSATGACDLAASGDPVGPSFEAKTIGYSSRFLAYGTVTFPGTMCNEQYVIDGFHTIDFNQLYHTPITTTTTTKEGCAPYVNPRLSLPAELTDVDPAWKTCQPLFYGAFDPPSILSKASRLAPAQADPAAVTPTPPPAPALPAAAQATPAAQTPAATTAPKVSAPLDGTDPPALIPPSEKDLHEAATGNPEPNSQVFPSAAAEQPAQNPSPDADPKPQSIEGGNENPPAPIPVSGIDQTSQNAAGGAGDPGSPVAGPAAPVIVNSPIQSPASAANVVLAQGTTLTENGPPASIGGKVAVYSSGSVYVDSTPVAVPTNAPVSPVNAVIAQGQTLTEGGPTANIGGKAVVYSAGSIYLDSSSPVAVPKAEDNNVVIAQGQTLTENGPTASIGGKPAVYSAGSVYYDSTPVAIPQASPTNVVVAQGQTLSENGPSVLIGDKTAMYKAGSIYYDSTPVAVPTPAPGQQDISPVAAAGVIFTPAVQDPSPVITNGITFAPAVEKASPVVANGITFAPISLPSSGNTREPVVVGGLTFQPSHVQSSNGIAIETPAPLLVGSDPVLKAADGGLLVAGSTISQGSTASLLGHVIAANNDNVVVDGTTHSLAPSTAHPIEAPTATPLEIANTPVLRATNGDLVIAGSTVSQGSITSLLGHAISVGSDNVVLDGTTHAFGPITAHPLETPAPLQIANQPVIKAANGGLIIAGTTIPQGSQTTLFGHVISVGTDNVVDDGTTLTFAPDNEVAGHQPITSLIYGSSNLITTLTPGATYSSGGHVTTYTGSTPSVLTEATSGVIGTTTIPSRSSALANQVLIESPVSTTPEPLFVEPSAAPSDVLPVGGLILAGFGTGAGTTDRSTNSSSSSSSSSSKIILPSVIMVNGSVAASSPSPSLSSPSSATLAPGSRATSSSGPLQGRASRMAGNRTAVVVVLCCGILSWLFIVALF